MAKLIVPFLQSFSSRFWDRIVSVIIKVVTFFPVWFFQLYNLFFFNWEVLSHWLWSHYFSKCSCFLDKWFKLFDNAVDNFCKIKVNFIIITRITNRNNVSSGVDKFLSRWPTFRTHNFTCAADLAKKMGGFRFRFTKSKSKCGSDWESTGNIAFSSLWPK